MMNKLKMMPTLAVAVGIAFGAASLSPLRADPIVIPSPTEDNAAAVIALTNALATAAAGTTITLSKGVYDLSGVVSDPDDGGSHLLIDKFLILRGDPDYNREEIVLRGGGSTRICRLKQDKKNLGPGYSPVFDNITFTNGCSTVLGGAIEHGSNDSRSAYVTNCVFRCCVSKASGAVHSATLSNCLFEDNQSTNGHGGAAARVIAYDCVFSNNVAYGNGGALIYASAYDSLFVSNRCAKASSYGGAISYCTEIQGCTFVGNGNNVLTYYGAAAHGNNTGGMTVSDCTFVGNNAYHGGILYFSGSAEGNVIGSRFYNNWASGGYAGAIAGNGNTRVYDCIFTNNASWSGVGVGNGVTIWSNCTFIANSFRNNNDSIDNPAGILGDSTDYSRCVARNCTFRDHFTTSKDDRIDPILPCERAYKVRTDACAAYMTLVDCTIEGTFYNCVAERCVITNAPSKTVAVVCGASVLTNCLVAANHLDDESSGIFASLTQFADAPQIVNCTVVDNSYAFGENISMFVGTTNAVAVNTLFYGNRRGDDGCDVVCNRANGLAMTNCLYQYIKTTGTGAKAISVNVNPVVLAAGKTPKFNAGRNSKFPYYMPEAKSLAANAGADLGYTDDDVDLGGYKRLRDGKVDIGAYSCYMPSPGFIIMFR